MPARLNRFVMALAVLLATACGSPRIRIEWTRPAPFQLPPNQAVGLLLETDGTPSATQLLDTAIGATQGRLLNKWLAVEPLRNELSALLQREGYTVVEPPKAELHLRVRPTGWTYQPGDQKKLTSGSGRLEAKVEVLDARNPGAPPLFTESYWARGSAEKAGEPEAMLRASQRLSEVFLSSLRPSRVSAVVELDDSDPVVEPGIELCKDGQFDAAYAAFTDIVARAPRSAPAHYNLGVLSEARGEYDQAESLILRATQLSPKPLYYTALERVRQARRDARGLQAQ